MGNIYNTQTLGEIANDIYCGREIEKNQISNQGFPCIRYSEIYEPKLFIKEPKDYVNSNLVKIQKYCEYCDLLIANRSNSIETIGKAVAYLNENTKCLVGNNISVVKHNQNPKYLAYALSTNYCRQQSKSLSNTGVITQLNSRSLRNIRIPLPSLKEQEENVLRLNKLHQICWDNSDGISKLIEEAEKQYEYYRDKIISIDN